MDEAVHFGHHDVVTILRDYHTQYSPQEPPTDKQSAEKNLDGMLWRDSAGGKKLDGCVSEDGMLWGENKKIWKFQDTWNQRRQ